MLAAVGGLHVDGHQVCVDAVPLVAVGLGGHIIVYRASAVSGKGSSSQPSLCRSSQESVSHSHRLEHVAYSLLGSASSRVRSTHRLVA